MVKYCLSTFQTNTIIFTFNLIHIKSSFETTPPQALRVALLGHYLKWSLPFYANTDQKCLKNADKIENLTF